MEVCFYGILIVEWLNDGVSFFYIDGKVFFISDFRGICLLGRVVFIYK